MIVRDEESIEQALQTLSVEGAVRYSDAFSYIIITTSETLEAQCRSALARNDVAIVVPRGQESEMEDYARTLTIVRKQRAVEEKREIRGWVKEHPELFSVPAEEIPRIVKRMRKRKQE